MTDDEITALITKAPIEREDDNWTLDLRPAINLTVSVEAPDEQTARSLITVDNVPPMMRDDYAPAPQPDLAAQVAELQQKVDALTAELKSA